MGPASGLAAYGDDCTHPRPVQGYGLLLADVLEYVDAFVNEQCIADAEPISKEPRSALHGEAETSGLTAYRHQIEILAQRIQPDHGERIIGRFQEYQKL